MKTSEASFKLCFGCAALVLWPCITGVMTECEAKPIHTAMVDQILRVQESDYVMSQ